MTLCRILYLHTYCGTISNSFLLSLPLVIKDQCIFRRQTVFALRLLPQLRCYFFLPLSLSLGGE